jgi:hypothetical protein
MRFLADENCDLAVVRALRSAGHDVALVKDLCPGADVMSAVSTFGAQLERAFTVIEPGQVRITKLDTA